MRRCAFTAGFDNRLSITVTCRRVPIRSTRHRPRDRRSPRRSRSPSLTGCARRRASGDGGRHASPSSPSTNVYGDIAETIGGDAVKVTSSSTDPAQDPHSFEASAQNQLALSQGRRGGRERRRLRRLHGHHARGGRRTPTPRCSTPSSSPGTTAPTAASSTSTSGTTSRPSRTLADRLVAALLDRPTPRRPPTFDAQRRRLRGASSPARRTGGAASRRRTPAPAWRSPSRCRCTCSRRPGWRTSTPRGVQRGHRGGHRRLRRPCSRRRSTCSASGQVALLVYNEQTTGPQTERVLAAAKAAGIPVVAGHRDPAGRPGLPELDAAEPRRRREGAVA